MICRVLAARFAALIVGLLSTAGVSLASPDAVFYVDDDASPGGDGLSWASAFESLPAAGAAAQAFATANPGAAIELRIGQGLYVPPTDNGFLLDIVNGNISIRGGYAGLGAADPDLQQPGSFRTVFSGDVLGNDPPLGSTADHTLPAFDDNRRVLINPDEQGSVEGITFERGMVAMTQLPTLMRDCDFRGMLIGVLGASPTDRTGIVSLRLLNEISVIERCDFDQNIADTIASIGVTSPTFVNTLLFDRCRFRRNVNRSSYGVVDAGLSSNRRPIIILNQCQFIANRVVGTGFQTGAVFLFLGEGLRVYNSLVYGNIVPVGTGAGVGTVQLQISQNEDRPVVQNTVFWNNVSEFGDGPNGVIPAPMRFLAGRVLRSNLIEGWNRPEALTDVQPIDDISGILDTQPLFVDPEGPDGILGTDDDDFRPAPGSPLIDAGVTVALPGEVRAGFDAPWQGAAPLDAAGNPRIVDDAFAVAADPANPIDIGPFELQPSDTDEDGDGAHDAAQIAADPSLDLDGNGRLDAAQPLIDCDGNGVRDSVDIALGAAADGDGNGVPDACQIQADPSLDADGSGVLDACEPALFFVDDDAPGGGDGASWATAFNSLDDALEIAERHRFAPTEVRVAQGFYIPNDDLRRFSSFQLSTDLTLRGGYAGLGAADPDERDPDQFVTVLSGDLYDDPDRLAHNVLTARAGVRNARVHGVVLQDGDARGGSASLLIVGFVLGDQPGQPTLTLTHGEFGAALHAIDAHVTLEEVTIRGMRSDAGGAISLLANSNVVILDSTLESSAILTSSHVEIEPFVAFYAKTGEASTLLADRLVIGDLAGNVFDAADADGELNLSRLSFAGPLTEPASLFFPSGVITISDSDLLDDNLVLAQTPSSTNNLRLDLDLTVENSVVGRVNETQFTLDSDDQSSFTFRNSRILGPGGITDWLRVSGVSASLLMESTVAFNGLRMLNGASTIKNSTFLLDFGTPVLTGPRTVYNSVFRRLDQTSTTFALFTSGANVDIQNTIVDNLSSDFGPTVFDADPLFVDPIGPDGVPFTGDEDLSLSPGSPAIDAGANSLVPPGLVTDVAGLPRFRDDPLTPDTGSGAAPVVDIGAYEYQPPCPGDANGDGLVNADDLLVVLGAFGSSTPGGPAAGDLNGDGLVNADDLLAVLGAFGSGC